MTISEFRRFGLATRRDATRRGFASASISIPECFYHRPSRRQVSGDDKRGGEYRGRAGQSTGREARQKEGRRRRIREGGTLDPLLGCLPHTADPDAAPANPRRATRVNKRIESVLVTRSSVLSSRFSSTVPFRFYFSPTNSSSLSLPLSFCRSSTPSVPSLRRSILTPTRSSPQSSIHTIPLLQLCSLSFSTSRYSNHPTFEFSNLFTRAARTFASCAICSLFRESLIVCNFYRLVTL